jgi:thioredoxin 1
MIYTTKIDSNNFDELIKSEKVSLVYISASWCGPCKILAPIVDEIINEKNGEVILAKIDADEQMDFVKSLNVRNIPTLLFYKNGELKERTTGLKNKMEINQILQEIESV